MISQTINIARLDHAMELFGQYDENIDIIRNKLHVQVVVRDGEIKITGDPEAVMIATNTINSLIDLIETGENISQHNVSYTL